MAVMSTGGLEGIADVDPYGIQWQAWRRPVPACFPVAGMGSLLGSWCNRTGA
jgi:hypothetical protein